MTNNRIQSEEKKFFTMVPNMVDDMGLDPYAHRLYIHLRRVAGEDGACWQNTETLAAICCMSAGKISASKAVLVDRGLIRITKARNQNGVYDRITVVDIWRANLDALAVARGDSPGEQPRGDSPGERGGSPHERPDSPGERGDSPHEPKKTSLRTPIKENPPEEEEQHSPAAPPCAPAGDEDLPAVVVNIDPAEGLSAEQLAVVEILLAVGVDPRAVCERLVLEHGADRCRAWAEWGRGRGQNPGGLVRARITSQQPTPAPSRRRGRPPAVMTPAEAEQYYHGGPYEHLIQR
ncbi:MAG: helix-turn-helix domain-containing protein [Chloroflexi bacterium]|nr:helix-turn-helix domain-containing protein [Chloroflexota bacterium]MBU1746178.1 helix-turn-helix domain-containing protein [Chloroflexota bacterium]